MGINCIGDRGCATADSAVDTTPPPDADNIAHRYYYWVDESGAAYLRKVAAAGGFPAYEKAHRQALDALAAKAFVRLPTEVAAHVVPFAFHVGYY